MPVEETHAGRQGRHEQNVIGCELAQAFARFGSRVHLVEALHGILPNEDRDAADIVWGSMARDGVELLCCGKDLQVAPAELEAVLVSHPAVADAAVVPRPDEGAGEVPVAFVALKGKATADEIDAFVSERVASYKRLHGVEFIEKIPRSPAGKILRRMLVNVGWPESG